MALSVLITQCLQNDFVAPVGSHEPLPNKLHVGREESLRLLGPDPTAGPVAQLMAWARAQDEDDLVILHIRDHHDTSDPRQADHLALFGHHCVRGTSGAALVLGLDDGVMARESERCVDSISLNDFEGTELADVFRALSQRSDGEPLRVGVVGVWTEAKVTFLLYDLKTRFGIDCLGTCSALTASSSRTHHFAALEQLRRILGVSIFDTVGEFEEWLLPDGTAPQLPVGQGMLDPLIELRGGELSAEDREIVGYLYRDAARVDLQPLSGGFSGAGVYKVSSRDVLGIEQAPSVLKLGPRALIGKERVAFEQVEAILGNNAPSVRGFADLDVRAGLKYSFAAMGQGGVRTLKSLFEDGAPQHRIDAILRTVFGEILEPFFAAAQYETLPLLDHYRFSPEHAPGVRANVEAIAGEGAADRAMLSFPGGLALPNVVPFYERFLRERPPVLGESHYRGFVHGDLNGANILLDARENVWIIDFFHTARGHVLQDLAKLENDLLYIWTKLATEEDLRTAIALTGTLAEVADLREPLPDSPDWLEGASPALRRAWATVRTLRGLAAELCRDDRDPLQLTIALLRYSAHTLSFDESFALQKQWALAASCVHARAIEETLRANARLRVDWVGEVVGPGRLGMTLCPGRRDRARSLDQDLDALVAAGTTILLSLVTQEELEWAGVSSLRAEAERRGIRFWHLPIPDQGTPSLGEARALVSDLVAALGGGGYVVVHCMGGLGRTGTIAACVLTERGMTARDAIAEVRRARSPRAIENPTQERFVAEFAAKPA